MRVSLRAWPCRAIANDRASPPLHPPVTPGSNPHLSLGQLSHPLKGSLYLQSGPHWLVATWWPRRTSKTQPLSSEWNTRTAWFLPLKPQWLGGVISSRLCLQSPIRDRSFLAPPSQSSRNTLPISLPHPRLRSVTSLSSITREDYLDPLWTMSI